jgi:hypothetical protein
LSIIKTCAATIFACTWTIQHLNVPATNDGEWRRFFRACKWMLVTVLLPEFILAHAILELVLAIRSMESKKAPPLVGRDPSQGEIRVEYPAWMPVIPAFVTAWSAIRSESLWVNTIETQAFDEGQTCPERPSRKYTWTLTHAYFANMGGFVSALPLGKPGDPRPVSSPEQPAPEQAAYPLSGIHLTLPDCFELPKITEREIKDKSKTEGLARAFSVFQISHLLVSLIVRLAQGLHSSQLEILTLAFAVCGVATYAIYWYKPKDIGVPIHVNVKHNISPDMLEVAAGLTTFDSFWKVVTNDPRHNQTALHRVPNDNIPPTGLDSHHTASYLLAFITTMFVSLHAIAWNFDFPTKTEEATWHICTVLTITLPILGLLGIPLSQATWQEGKRGNFRKHTIRVLDELFRHLDDEDREKPIIDLARRGLLETLCRSPTASPSSRARGRPYASLLGSRDTRQKILDFVERKEPFQNRRDFYLPREYAYHLRRLFRLIDGHGSKRMVEQVARTDVFPRYSLPRAFNVGLVYVTMGLYCVARLTLVGIGFSSLRAMPQGVYKATWADYMPAI